MQRQEAFRRRAIARKQAREHFRIKTPEAVQGRQHVDVQTGEILCVNVFSDLLLNLGIKVPFPTFPEPYLEELGNIIEATDIECQTDEFLDKPATPLFVPAKSGVDAETQIEEGEVSTFSRNLVKKCILHIDRQ